ncbi:MAG: hypothetical protein M1825_003239 [Sarcosagium campestre]|nr:MAG: hypothetical protein M1825_003239 [Sarcosagium campestre]
MSLTATLSPSARILSSSSGRPVTPHSCPNCGIGLESRPGSPQVSIADIPQDVAQQRRISELESQVKILTNKATSAVDKLADYEDELRRLKTTAGTTPTSDQQANVTTSASIANPSSRTASPLPPPTPTAATPSATSTPVASRLSSLLSARKSASATVHNATSSSTPPPTPVPDLASALAHEKQLRAQAEGKLTNASAELEELSAALFGQANEMVAQERKARSKLEERVRVLENRDKEKRLRLERLEKAVGRVERVRGMLSGGGPGSNDTNANSNTNSNVGIGAR